MQGGFHLAPIGSVAAACGGVVRAMQLDHISRVRILDYIPVQVTK